MIQVKASKFWLDLNDQFLTFEFDELSDHKKTLINSCIIHMYMSRP